MRTVWSVFVALFVLTHALVSGHDPRLAFAHDEIDWDAEIGRLFEEARLHERRYPGLASEALVKAERIANQHFGQMDWRARDAKSWRDRIDRWSMLSVQDRLRLDRALDDCRHAMNLYRKEGPRNAVEIHRKALATIAQVVGTNVREYATQLDNLASLEDASGNVDDALELRLAALRVMIDEFGLNHAATATGTVNTAATILSLGHPEIAHVLYNRALETMEARGTKGGHLASGLANLAQCELHLQRPQSALVHLDKALNLLADEHDSLGRSYLTARFQLLRATALIEQKHAIQAIAAAEESLNVFAGQLPDDRDRTQAEVVLAWSKAESGAVNDAQRLLGDIERQRQQDAIVATATILFFEGEAYDALSNRAEAVNKFEEALRVIGAENPANHSLSAHFLVRLAKLKGKDDMAEHSRLMNLARVEERAHIAAAQEVLVKVEGAGIVFDEEERKVMSNNYKRLAAP